MYHFRLKGSHYEMGAGRGSIFKKCGIKFPLNMDDFQLSHGMESENNYQDVIYLSFWD